MPRRASYDRAAVDALFARQSGVATHAQLVELGMPLSTVTHRIGVRAPWQRLLPGVVLCHRGTPSRRELVIGALLYAGAGATVTGLEALRAYGVRAAQGQRQVHVLVPEARRRADFDYVHVERTRRMPPQTVVADVPLAPTARAVVDACRLLRRLDDVRELIAEVVQRGLVRVAELMDTVRASARQRTALTNAVLREIGAGIRSVAEAKAREMIVRMPIPQPEWNVTLRLSSGTFLASPDAYWELLAAALEIDSIAWHLSPAAYKRTQRRQRRLVARAGVMVLPIAPSDLLDNAAAFEEDLQAFLHQASQRTPPTDLVVVRRDAA